MEINKVLENLCIYDKRNPYNINKSDVKPKDCLCDNCFYGRNKLAEEILRLKENTKNHC